MGPPIYIGGNKYQAELRKRAEMASMGPPIYIGGNQLMVELQMAQTGASMGPPIYIGGNDPDARPGPRPNQSFNGATDLHRWKL